MSKFSKFEEIKVWEKSQKLAIEIYKIFNVNRAFSFKDQIQRTTISISNNISECFEIKGNKEFKRFLYIAKGSCGEVRSMIYLALDLEYINKNQFDFLYKESVEISKMLSGLVKVLK